MADPAEELHQQENFEMLCVICQEESRSYIECENHHSTCDSCFASQRRNIDYAVLQCGVCRGAFEGHSEIRELQLQPEEAESRAINNMASQVTVDSDAETVRPDPEPHMEASYQPSVVEVDSQGQAVDGHAQTGREPPTSPVPDPRPENWVFVPTVTPARRARRTSVPAPGRRRNRGQARARSPTLAVIQEQPTIRVCRQRNGRTTFMRELEDGAFEEVTREELASIPNFADTASVVVLRAIAHAWLNQN